MQVVVIHEGATLGANTIDGVAGSPWQGPIMAITEALQDTSVDLVIAGHTHRITNTVVGHIPVIEGVNAGGSYSVAQLMVRNGDVAWVERSDACRQEPRCRAARRRAGDRRPRRTPTRRCCATR